MSEMFFDGWWGILRVLLVGTLSYLVLLILLRISRKRTLSEMNAFDLIVTVASGSSLASILLNQRVALSEGVTAIGLLIGLQYVISWTSVRFRFFNRLVTAEPALLFFRGRFLEDAMKLERITRQEVLAEIRHAGIATLDDVEAIVFESGGNLSIVRVSEKQSHSTLRDLPNKSQET